MSTYDYLRKPYNCRKNKCGSGGSGSSTTSSGTFFTTSPVSNPIGMFTSNQTVTQVDNMSINTAINNILHKDNPPIIVFSTVPTKTINEVGEKIYGVTLNTTITSLGTSNIVRVEFYKSSTLLSSQSYSGSSRTYTYNDTATIENDVTYSTKVYYSFGAGNNVINSKIDFRFVRNAFFGTTKDVVFDITSDNIRSLKSSADIKKGNTITLNIPKGSTNVIFAYPSSLNDVTSVKYVEGMNADIKDVFTKTTALISGANNSSPDTYNIYTYKPVTAFTQDVTYKITI